MPTVVFTQREYSVVICSLALAIWSTVWGKIVELEEGKQADGQSPVDEVLLFNLPFACKLSVQLQPRHVGLCWGP